MKFIFLYLFPIIVFAQDANWASRNGNYRLIHTEKRQNMFFSERVYPEAEVVVNFNFAGPKVVAKFSKHYNPELMNSTWNLVRNMGFEKTKSVDHHTWSLMLFICSKDVHTTKSSNYKVKNKLQTKTFYFCFIPNFDKEVVKLKFSKNGNTLKVIHVDSGSVERKVIYTFIKSLE